MKRINQEFLNKAQVKYEKLDSNGKIYNPFNEDNDSDTSKKNLLRLFIGMIPSNLPKNLFLPGLGELLLDLTNIHPTNKSKSRIKSLENDLYNAFSKFVKIFNCYNTGKNKNKNIIFTNYFRPGSKLIALFGNYETPTYIYKNGVEPIKYDSIKNYNQMMLMGVDNPLLYLIFIYNTFIALRPLFHKLYFSQNKEINNVVSSSESPILLRNKLINMEYYYPNSEYSYFNRKIKNSSSVENGVLHKFKLENEHPYYMVLNLQSFYPNIYTHNLDRASRHDLFRIIENNSKYKDIIIDYLSFLDKYNMKNNEERTKGIIIGPISSRISSELLSLDIYYQAEYGSKYNKGPMRLIDNDLSNILQNKNVEYTRYIDNVVVFADNLNILEQLRFKLGRFLQQYELKFQNSKCKIVKGIYMPKMANFYSISKNVPIFHDIDLSHKVSLYDFITFRRYIKYLINIKDLSTVKAIFNEIINIGPKINFENDELIELFMSFILKVAIICPTVSYNIYEVLAQSIIRTTTSHNYDLTIKTQLCKTLKLVNDFYDDTTLQVWTYYLLNLIYDKYGLYNKKINLFKKMPKALKSYPLVIMSFISKYNSNELNNDIWNCIYHEYERDENNVTGNKFQCSNIYKTIMFSKWAFPIYKLHALCNMYDNPKSECSISRIFLGKNKNKNNYNIFRLFDIMLDSIKNNLTGYDSVGMK